jgi:hypothetical protein
VLVDVGDHLLGRRSSSAPKKAAADFKISLARRNSRTSRSSVFSRSRSSLVSPGRNPSSVSAFRTHQSLQESRDARIARQVALRASKSATRAWWTSRTR